MKEMIKKIYNAITIKELFLAFLFLCILIYIKLSQIDHSLLYIGKRLDLLYIK